MGNSAPAEVYNSQFPIVYNSQCYPYHGRSRSPLQNMVFGFCSEESETSSRAFWTRERREKNINKADGSGKDADVLRIRAAKATTICTGGSDGDLLDMWKNTLQDAEVLIPFSMLEPINFNLNHAGEEQRDANEFWPPGSGT